MNKYLALTVVFLGVLCGVTSVDWTTKPATILLPKPKVIEQPTPRVPSTPTIAQPNPAFQTYPEIRQQLARWVAEAPELAEMGNYGQSSRGQELIYLKVTNRLSEGAKKKVLITGCIHGNEPLSTSTVMWTIGSMLKSYGKDPEVTRLLDTREIYFVPVVSPDSFASTRFVDGVDPNRDFSGPHDPNRRSVPPIRALGDFVIQKKFDAAISGHTFGRVFLYPYGDRTERCPHDADYQRILGQMSKMSGYRVDRCCNNYGHPIFGTEVDFYYCHGVFAVVMEFGTHQRRPSVSDIQDEFNRTYRSILYFIREAPEVNMSRK